MVSSFFYITKNTLYQSQNNSYLPILYRKLTFFMRFRKRIDSFLQIITLKTDHQELLRSVHFRCICFFSRHKLLRMLGVETCGF